MIPAKVNRRRVMVAAAACFALAALAMASRGLHIEITNETTAPLLDVRVAHPGGAWVVGRIEPGGRVEATVRFPLAGLWGRSRECPVSWTFTHNEERSQPFDLRCELGVWGLRDLFLIADQICGPRSVGAGAKMAGPSHLDLDRLVRSSLNPATGPSRFLGRRFYGYRRDVIRHIDYVTEVQEWIGDLAYLAGETLARPDGLGHIVRELAEALACRSASRTAQELEFRLPFRDLNEASRDSHATIEQRPLWP